MKGQMEFLRPQASMSWRRDITRLRRTAVSKGPVSASSSPWVSLGLVNDHCTRKLFPYRVWRRMLLQSSAPRRHRYTSAASNTPAKITISQYPDQPNSRPATAQAKMNAASRSKMTRTSPPGRTWPTDAHAPILPRQCRIRTELPLRSRDVSGRAGTTPPASRSRERGQVQSKRQVPRVSCLC